MYQNKYVCFDRIMWLIMMKMRLKMKSRSHRYDLNSPQPRHENKFTKYKIYHSTMVFVCIKKHLSKILTSLHEKVKQQWGWDEKNSCL